MRNKLHCAQQRQRNLRDPFLLCDPVSQNRRENHSEETGLVLDQKGNGSVPDDLIPCLCFYYDFLLTVFRREYTGKAAGFLDVKPFVFCSRCFPGPVCEGRKRKDRTNDLPPLEAYWNLNTGYMLSFNFNKNKEQGVKRVLVGDKVLFEGTV